MARVVVFRQIGSEYSSRLAAIRLDENKIGYCDYRTFRVFEAVPGKHTLEVYMWDSLGKCKLPITLSPGSENFYEIKPNPNYTEPTLIAEATEGELKGASEDCSGAFSIEAIHQREAVCLLENIKKMKQ